MDTGKQQNLVGAGRGRQKFTGELKTIIKSLTLYFWGCHLPGNFFHGGGATASYSEQVSRPREHKAKTPFSRVTSTCLLHLGMFLPISNSGVFIRELSLEEPDVCHTAGRAG